MVAAKTFKLAKFLMIPAGGVCKNFGPPFLGSMRFCSHFVFFCWFVWPLGPAEVEAFLLVWPETEPAEEVEATCFFLASSSPSSYRRTFARAFTRFSTGSQLFSHFSPPSSSFHLIRYCTVPSITFLLSTFSTSYSSLSVGAA
ncbi:hypothetical protein TYRP_001741 [Tyrophagus putrescentiae]|nr:hypothetical protein TYRP_001741 [Tyrophagus putrescentiae]